MSKRDASLPLYADPVFRTACELEDTVKEARDLAHGILLIASENPELTPVFTMARLIMERVEMIDEARGKIFHLTHPSRAEWEKAGGVEKWRKQLTRAA